MCIEVFEVSGVFKVWEVSDVQKVQWVQYVQKVEIPNPKQQTTNNKRQTTNPILDVLKKYFKKLWIWILVIYFYPPLTFYSHLN